MGKGIETRTAILHAGVETAYKVGLGGLTIGELARRTGLSKSGLFAHFQSKESLQLAVLGQAREEFIASVLQPAILGPRGETRVRALFDNWLACVLRRMPGGCLFVKALSEFEDQTGPVHDQVVLGHRDLYDSIAQIVRTAIAEGQFAADLDPMQFAYDLDGIMLVAYHWLQLIDPADAEARARRAFATLLDAARQPS